MTRLFDDSLQKLRLRVRLFDEIVKYNPSGYNAEGHYVLDEWTDISDIGKCFNHTRLSYRDYLTVETQYVQTATELLIMSGCKYITVVYYDLGYEVSEDSVVVNDRIPHNHPLSTANVIGELGHVYGHGRLSITQFRLMLRLVLRGYVGCAFVNRAKEVQVDVGWDYYMHVYAPRIYYPELFYIARKHGLYCSPRSGYSLSGTKWDSVFEKWIRWLSEGMTTDISSCDFALFMSGNDSEASELWSAFYLGLRAAAYLKCGIKVAMRFNYDMLPQDAPVSVQELVESSPLPKSIGIVKYKGSKASIFANVQIYKECTACSIYTVYSAFSEGKHMLLVC